MRQNQSWKKSFTTFVILRSSESDRSRLCQRREITHSRTWRLHHEMLPLRRTVLLRLWDLKRLVIFSDHEIHWIDFANLRLDEVVVLEKTDELIYKYLNS